MNNECKEKIIKSNINAYFNEPMSKYTSFKIGGPADCLVKVKTEDELILIKEIAKKYNEPTYILGNGSNILVKDNGISGIVIKMDNDYLDIEIKEGKGKIIAGAGVKLAFLSQKCYQEGLEGIEFAAGIPGTIGGAVRMNAGAHGGEIKDIVISTKYLSKDGKIEIINNKQHDFSYRHSAFMENEGIIIETVLELKIGDKNSIKEKMDNNLSWRKEKQPLEYPSAGSVFKRGDDYVTAQLIDLCGLKGYQVGGAQISEKHAGFIVNKDKATAKDVIEIIKHAKEEVYEKFEKKIQLEVEIIGK